jgi:hypothetical protein
MVIKSKLISRISCAFMGMVLLTGVALTAYRTHERAGDAYSLIRLAGLDEADLSLNPFSNAGCLITPNLAVWILENFNSPYSLCLQLSHSLNICGIPLIIWTGRGLGMGPPAADERLYRVMHHLIRRGESVNASHDGLTALHEAVLYGNPQYAETLLAYGADPYAKIQRPGKKSHGLNAFEFAELLSTREPNRFDAVRAVLTRFRERHPSATISETQTQLH